MKLTEYQKRDYQEVLDTLEAVVRLARANFPRDNGIKIETHGSSPSASISIYPAILQFLIDAGRSALTQGE